MGPDLNSPDEQASDQSDYSPDVRFDLRPEFPSHVPTPETINLGINHHIKTMFDGDDEKPRKRTRRQRNRKKNAKSMKLIVPPNPTIIASTSKMKILVASPFSTKWGSDVWNSIKINGQIDSSESVRTNSSSRSNSDDSSNSDSNDETSLASDKTPRQRQSNTRNGSLRRNRAKGSATPPRSVGKSLNAEKKSIPISPTFNASTLEPSKSKERWMLSGEKLERIEPMASQK